MAFVSVCGACLATAIFVCTVVAFMPNRLALFLPLVLIVIATLSFLPEALLHSVSSVLPWRLKHVIGPRRWLELLFAVTSITFFGSMFVFRLHGYRWVRPKGVAPAKVGAVSEAEKAKPLAYDGEPIRGEV